MDTGMGASHMASVVGVKRGTAVVGGWGGITWGEMSDVGDGGDGGSKPHCHVCTYAAILHDLHMYPRT